jgi:aryl-alcohol dehydrogenase-like predicted oxidoreductase
MAAMIPGYATPEGTERYAARLGGSVSPEHFRSREQGLRVSTLGIGTYLGLEDAATDAMYQRSVARALERGLNVVDAAINYRRQRSERAVGAVLAELVARGELRRDEVLVSTKGGFIPLDGQNPRDPGAYFAETYLRPGIVHPDDVVGGAHCMTPRYLTDQIGRSRTNLGLETIDVYYLHNPESQLAEIDRPQFLRRIRAAFEALELAVADGRIRCYGTATWDGYRRDPTARDYLSLAELVATARDVAGDGHHFEVIQLPYNLAMPEALTRANQRLEGEMVSLLEAARRFDLYVVVSASVYQGQLTRNLPPLIAEYLPGLATDAQRALQFVRSTPGVGTALVGMKSVAHVDENAGIATKPPVPWEQFRRLFTEAP